MNRIVLGGLTATVLAFGAVAQTQTPGASAISPPPTTLPQPQLRSPADQAVSTGTSTTPAPVTGSGMNAERARALIGTDLVGADERRAGEIDNLLLDGTGEVRAAVVEWGGFLGLGQRKAVVPIERIRFGATESDKARLSVSREELEALPAYDRDRMGDYQTRFGWQGLRTLR